MNVFQYKDGADLLRQTGWTPDEAIEWLDNRLEQIRRREGKS